MLFMATRGTSGALGSALTRGAKTGLTPSTSPRSLENIRPNVNLKEIRTRIDSVKNTKKITASMKLVAAAKVRKAQAAVLGGRPFADNLVRTLYAINQKVIADDLESALTQIRPVKNVLLVTVSGDRGLCGGYNTFVLKKMLARAEELEGMGIGVKHISVGNKISQWLSRRGDKFEVLSKQAVQDIMGAKGSDEEERADALSAFSEEILSGFTDGEFDKVEIIYTKFRSLIGSDPVIQTVLPLTAAGEICDINGNCIDAADDEIFRLTTKKGDVAVETEKSSTDLADNINNVIFEQPPNEVADAILPLYMDSSVLRSLQESLASELAARMNAMSAACDNADELKGKLQLQYNRGRQSKITSEILEIVGGASAV